MFKIENTTDRDVVLDDLRIVLGPHKDIDLDRIAPRHQTESSLKLRLAIQQNRIKVTGKDTDKITNAAAPEKENSVLREMEERLKEDFRKQLASVIQQVVKSTPKEQDKPKQELTPNVAELMGTIQSLVTELKNRPAASSINSADNNTVQNSSRDDIPDDISNRLHAKVMKRLEQQVTGHVETESKTTTDENLQKNIDALDGLF